MKVLVKNLKGEVSEYECEGDVKISGLKERIKESKGIEITTQKLVYKGKNPVDETTLSELGFKEGEFMVLMVSKTKPVEEVKPEPEKPKETVQPKPEQKETTTTTTSKESEKKTETTKSDSPSKTADTVADHASTLLHGEQLNKTVDEICSMGFEKPQVIKALKAAFYNPDRAIEYLFSGIPEVQEAQPIPSSGGRSSGGSSNPLGGLSNPQQTSPQQQSTQQQQSQSGGGSGSGSGGENPLAFLLNDPNFPALRAAIQQNPNLLQPILAQLAQSNPQVLQLITQNQEAFMRLLLEGGQPGSAGGRGGSGGRSGNVIRLTQEEKAAVDRLVEFGFDQRSALEAYLACDKNENLAANYLFERQAEEGFDFGGGSQGGSNPSGGNQGSGNQSGGNQSSGNQSSGNQSGGQGGSGNQSGGNNNQGGNQGGDKKNDDDDNLFS